LTTGSSFFHAQGSYEDTSGPEAQGLGDALDNTPISLLAYVAHQGSLNSLPYSPVLHRLGNGSREDAGVYAEEMVNVFGGEGVERWNETLRGEIYS